MKARDERFHAKELVLGVEVAGRCRAYLGSLVTKAGGQVEDELGGKKISLHYRTDDGIFNYDVAEGAWR